MKNFKEGDVVIVPSLEIGTVVEYGPNLCVLLSTGCIWYGFENQVILTQDNTTLE